jgi:hypothetical protein
MEAYVYLSHPKAIINGKHQYNIMHLLLLSLQVTTESSSGDANSHFVILVI